MRSRLLCFFAVDMNEWPPDCCLFLLPSVCVCVSGPGGAVQTGPQPLQVSTLGVQCWHRRRGPLLQRLPPPAGGPALRVLEEMKKVQTRIAFPYTFLPPRMYRCELTCSQRCIIFDTRHHSVNGMDRGQCGVRWVKRASMYSDGWPIHQCGEIEKSNHEVICLWKM